MDVPYNLHRRLKDQVAEQVMWPLFVFASFQQEIECIEREDILVDQSRSGIENKICNYSIQLIEETKLEGGIRSYGLCVV